MAEGAHGRLVNFIAQHAHAGRLKRARVRRLRPVRPDRRVEVWYRGELLKIVAECTAAGEDVATALRPRWPAVTDAVPSGLDGILREMAHRFIGIGATAERLTNVADKLSLVRRGLTSVDARLIASVRAAVGVDITFLIGGVSTISQGLARAAKANVELIKSIPAQYLDKVRDVVEKAFSTGQRWESVVEAIRHVGQVTKARAKLIARDQVGKMNSDFNRIRQTGLGITHYTWSTAHDERVRRSHAALDGTTQEWNRPPLVDGEAVNPGDAVNCRCAAIPIVNLGEIPVATAAAYAEAA